MESADKALVPAAGGLMFFIKPGPGVEEACVDPTEAHTKRCTAGDGCAPGTPPGSEGIDAGGVPLPPGTTPGDGTSSGDYP